jgi:hypothetical protein
MKAPLFIGIASFVTSLVLIVLLMQIPAAAGWPLTALGYLVGGVCHGLAYGFVLRRPCAVPAGWGSFAAAAVVSVPVVLVTFGAALVVAPLLVMFAVIVGVAAHFGGRFGRRGHAA